MIDALEPSRRRGRVPSDRAVDSGIISLRMPKSMHARLREHAAAEGVSLNQFILALLAEGLGRTEREREALT